MKLLLLLLTTTALAAPRVSFPVVRHPPVILTLPTYSREELLLIDVLQRNHDNAAIKEAMSVTNSARTYWRTRKETLSFAIEQAYSILASK
jgi:hypothetical protein